ncbi:MAG: hypothetical protein AB4911_04940 [Oscillochloridaceae bacterium umkhey_bin13]
MGELLGALGLAWPRLVIYPGGLSALVASWLLARWLAWCLRQPSPVVRPVQPGAIGDLLAPLLALSLLPLAPAASFPYGLDLIVALALLEWPHARHHLASDDQHSYLERCWPLLLAAAGLAVASRGLDLSRLLRWPQSLPHQGLLISSSLLWLVSLPGWLGAAPTSWPLRLRSLGLVWLGSLPLLGGLAALRPDALTPAVAAWILPGVASLISAGLVGVACLLPVQARAWLIYALALLVVGLIAWGLI